MSGTCKLRGNFLCWVRIGECDVAVYMDKKYIENLARRATTNIKRISQKGPIMCHAMRGRVAGNWRHVQPGFEWSTGRRV